MHNRLRAGWRCLTLAAAAAALVALPVSDVFAGGFGPARPGDSVNTVDHPEPTFRKPLLFPRSNYLWPFESGPVYGEVDSSRWNEAGVLHTAVGSFDLAAGWPKFPAALSTSVKFDRLPAQYFVLQVHPDSFLDGTFDAIRASLESAGGAIVQEMPVAAFVVRLTAGAHASIQGNPSILTLQPYHPALKLNPTIGRIPLADPMKAVSEVYTLDLRLFPGEDANLVASAVQALGVGVSLVTPDTITVDATRSQLASLAALEPVAMIFEQLPAFVKGEETSVTMQVGGGPEEGGWVRVRPYTDAGIDGSGGGKPGTSPQRLVVLDSGIQLDATDLAHSLANADPAGPGHRKVHVYETTNQFGGNGDLLGCDKVESGGLTHGHMVSSTALGNAEDIDPGAEALDGGGNPWAYDGVAPGARVIAYDASVTPASGLGCDEPGQGGVNGGDLYTSPSGGSLGVSYTTHSAKLTNYSWGAENANVYQTQATDIDTFLFEKQDAMVFIAAGNSAQDTNADGIVDPSSVSEPATAKNAIVVGGSASANQTGSGPNTRYGSSSVGPVVTGATNCATSPHLCRVAPILTAVATSAAGVGVATEYSCRTALNTQNEPVDCLQVDGISGTSFASPAAAGAGLVVRDYFAQGFYPDGTDTNPGNASDQALNISGSLLKAILVASADWMNGTGNNPGGNLLQRYRFNNEQGYGRIQLNRVLPLATYDSPLGLIVCGENSPCHTSPVDGNVAGGSTETYSLIVTDRNEPLTIALAWMDPAGSALSRNLNLEVVSPSGLVYYGNFFTDDDNKDGDIDQPGGGNPNPEGCTYTAAVPWPGLSSTTNTVDTGPWSLPVSGTGVTCGTNPDRDITNPTEAVFLSNDAAANGLVDLPSSPIDETADNQIEIGTWQVKVINASGTATGYGIAIAGPVQLGSSVRVQRLRSDGTLSGGAFVCNDRARIVVNEISEASDAGMNNNATEVSARTILEVVDSGPDTIPGNGDDFVTDTETLLSFTDLDGAGAGLRYESSELYLTDGTLPEAENGALDIRSGQRVRVTYQDEDNGVANPDKKRVSETSVDCRVEILQGGVVWSQFGRNSSTFINGGCERDLRGLYTFGFPDKYMDEDETLGYRIAFLLQGSEGIDDAQVSLKAVAVDGDSPSDCNPGTVGHCPDPNRLNNPISPYATILNPQQTLGRIAAASAVSANFTVQMASSIPANTEIEMVLGVAARKSGKPVESFVVSRHLLDVDEVSFFYSTDFPNSGAENRDVNNDEYIEAITTSANVFDLDYVVESRSFSNLKANGRNPNIGSPWNFDSGRQGWTVGQSNTSTSVLASRPAQWGEDRNFNNLLDAGEDRNTVNGALDYGWGTSGGCGWQTNTTGGPTGGAWHSGRIGPTSGTCTSATGTPQCQRFGILSALGTNQWVEILQSPEMEKVNRCPTGAEPGCNGRADTEERPTFQVEFTDWAWNMSMDLPSPHTGLLWELDTDTLNTQPIDLYNDLSLLNFYFGEQGAISGGNAPITDGFNLFANLSKCVDTDGNGVRDHCGNASGVACTSDTQCTGLSYNGSVGGNRQAKNSCFFEGKAGDVVRAIEPYGLALPADDDVANGYCARGDDLNNVDRSTSCTVATQAAVCSPSVNPDFTGFCTAANAVVDEYVTANGPIRNFSVEDVNGPDMRFTTLEDFYGDSGETFRAAMGFYTSQGTQNIGLSVNGYGVAFDDQVVEWREFRLDEDVTDCAGVGKCASLELAQTNMFEGSTILKVSVLDLSPHGPTGVNDCDNNGLYTDPGDDTDCDNNGTTDVVVRALSDGEPAGEIFFANQTSDPARFTVNIPTSFSYDSPQTLFLTPGSPLARVQYRDMNDGTGAVCKNASEPEQRGVIEENTSVDVTAGRIALKGVRVQDITGDLDGFADDGEEIELYLTLTNKSGVDLETVAVSIQAADLDSENRIACISRPSVSVGALAFKASAETPVPLKFTVGTVGRLPGEVDVAKPITFNVTIRTDRFDALTRNVTFSLDTDLNASGGSGPGQFVEDFEVNGFNSFTSQSIDAGRESLAGSNGYRCQYNDPDGPFSNSSGRTSCYMGETGNDYDWHIDDNESPLRAFTGTKSLHWGVHGQTAARDTTRVSQLDAIRLNGTINLGVGNVNPELSFKHQISLADNRISNTPDGQAADRGVVHIQLADSGGLPVGNWVKIYPYENEYDARGVDFFSNCTFDPVDDGNNEDSFYDPTDPFRRTGPSSTCEPEFTFAYHGDTDYRSTTPDLTKIGRAFDGPGLQGAVGPGTWVQPKFALNQYKGRKLRFRFVATSIEVAGATLMDEVLGSENSVGDDGWWIDDVRVTDTLTTAATLSADVTNLQPTGCVDCSTVVADLIANPAVSQAPGQPVVLNAGGSSANSCLNGALQFLFFSDANLNGTYDPGSDPILRDWTDNSGYLDAPLVDVTYGVAVRCSSDPTCQSSTTEFVDVICPTAGGSVSYFNGAINVKKTAPEVTWSVSQSFDAVQINGNTLRSSGGDFNAAKESCVANEGSGSSLSWNPAVTPGQWKAILLRPGGGSFCNALGSYSSQAPTESAGRDGEIGSICP